MKYNKTFKEALKQVREDGHVDVASAIRKCKTTIEDAGQLLSKLQTMDPEGGLPSWWNSKLTIAANSMNKLRDYLLIPSMTKEDMKEFNHNRHVGLKHDDPAKAKDKTVKPEPNPDTGEIPLRTGLANALLDKNAKNKPEMKGVNKKKLKMSLGKSKVEVNPNVEIGVFSGGKNTPTGNLH